MLFMYIQYCAECKGHLIRYQHHFVSRKLHEEKNMRKPKSTKQSRKVFRMLGTTYLCKVKWKNKIIIIILHDEVPKRSSTFPEINYIHKEWFYLIFFLCLLHFKWSLLLNLKKICLYEITLKLPASFTQYHIFKVRHHNFY